MDIAYLNIASTFYYLCLVLDGCSRFIVHWELREQMTEMDVELTVQRAREQYLTARPPSSPTTARTPSRATSRDLFAWRA